MKILLAIFHSLSFATILFAEKPFSVNFIPVYGQQQIILTERSHPLSGRDSIRFDVLKFYVSSVRLYLNDQQAFAEKNSFHLIDCSDKNKMQVKFDVADNIKFNTLKFNLGIDSITNNAGAMGGDLDPTNGMYWTWQSGYINFKLEGVSSKCPSRNHEFQFHLGGYAFPDNALRQIEINTNENDNVNIVLDIKKFIEEVNISEHEHVMSPGKKAMDFSSLASECFQLKQQ